MQTVGTAHCNALFSSVAYGDSFPNGEAYVILIKPSPVGEGGPRQRWMRCLYTKQNGGRQTAPYGL